MVPKTSYRNSNDRTPLYSYLYFHTTHFFESKSTHSCVCWQLTFVLADNDDEFGHLSSHNTQHSNSVQCNIMYVSTWLLCTCKQYNFHSNVGCFLLPTTISSCHNDFVHGLYELGQRLQIAEKYCEFYLLFDSVRFAPFANHSPLLFIQIIFFLFVHQRDIPNSFSLFINMYCIFTLSNQNTKYFLFFKFVLYWPSTFISA